MPLDFRYKATCDSAKPAVFIAKIAPGHALPLHRDLLGLSIETTSFRDWAQGADTSSDASNSFVYRILENLGHLTQSPVPIRIGGSSADLTTVSSVVEADRIVAHFPESTLWSPYPAASAAQISPDFYSLCHNFPPKTPFTINVNLACLQAAETARQVKAALKCFNDGRNVRPSAPTLKCFELGNEPDFYTVPMFGIRLPSFDMFEWSAAWLSAAEAVEEELDKQDARSRPSLALPSCSAALPFSDPCMWSSANVLGCGIMQHPVARNISTYSVHFYQGANTGNPDKNPPPGSFFKKENVRRSVQRFSEQIGAASRLGLDFELSETNSAANGGIAGISDAAEAACWIVDYALYHASLGTRRLYLHNREGMPYSIATPCVTARSIELDKTARVNAGYYGMIMVNEAIGSQPGLTISEVATNTNDIGGYAIYQQGHLARVVLLNYVTFLPGDVARSVQRVAIKGISPSSHTGRVRVKRFRTPFTNSTAGLWGGFCSAWNGIVFEAGTGNAVGQPSVEYLQNECIEIQATEVVMLDLMN